MPVLFVLFVLFVFCSFCLLNQRESWLANLVPNTIVPVLFILFPIASGVIEGACRHLVKDRMERTGMRWREPSARSMLFARALEVTGLWEPFQIHRQAVECLRLHPHQKLLNDYTPNLAIAL